MLTTHRAGCWLLLLVASAGAHAAPIPTKPDAKRIAAVAAQLAQATEQYQAALATVKYTDPGDGVAPEGAPPAHQRSQTAWEARFAHEDFLPSLPDEVRDALTTPSTRRTKAQAIALRDYYLSHANAATRAALHPLATRVDALMLHQECIHDRYTYDDYLREHEAFRRQRMEASYLLHTHDTGEARTTSLAFLRHYAKEAASFHPLGDVAKQLGREARDVGTTDPLVLLYSTIDMRGDAAREEPILVDAIARLEGSGYAALASCTARRWHFGGRLAHPEHDAERSARSTAMIAAMIRYSAAEREYPEQQRFVYNQMVGPLNDFQIGELETAHKAVSAAKEMHPWTQRMVLAKIHTRLAWIHRGGGFIGEVTPEGLAQFKAHSAAAKEHYTAAYELAPHFPEAAALMISVANETGDRKPSAREWFDRAMAAQIDWLDAHVNMMNALSPRWGGSVDEMLAFGEECAASERYDTEVPWQLVNVALAIGQDTGANVWKTPKVYEPVKAMIRKRVEYDQAQKPDEVSSIPLSWLVAIAYRADKFEDAQAAIEQLGGEVNATVLKQAGITGQDFRERIEAALSKQHAVIVAAEAALAAEPLDVATFPEHVKALRAFREREMGGPRNRADDLIVRLLSVQSYETGQWTAILFDDRLSQWDVLQGEWRHDEGRVIGQDRGTPGMLLRWRHPVSGPCIFEVDVQLLEIGQGENQGLVPAGIAVGDYHWRSHPFSGRLFWVDSHEKKCGTVSGEFDPIGGDAPTKAINRLRVHAWEGFYIITLNGHEFLRKADAAFSPDGHLALANLMNIPQNHTMRFSDVRIRKMDWPPPDDKTETVAYYNKWIAEEPDNAMAYARRATMRGLEQNDLDGAIADALEALKLDPAQNEAQARLGIFYLEKGNYAKAKEHLLLALPHSNSTTVVQELLIGIEASAPLDDLRDGAAALARAQALNEASGHRATRHVELLASAYAETGDFDNAVRWQTKVVKLAPDDAPAQARLELFRARKPYRDPLGPRVVVSREKSLPRLDNGADPQITAGLVARWPLDGHLRETWQNAKVQLQGRSEKFSPGRVGDALNCAQATCIDAGNVAGFERSSRFSYGGWAYVDSHAQAAIVAKLSTELHKRGHGLLLAHNRLRLLLASNDETGIALEVEVPTDVPLKKWFHVYVTYDGSSSDAGVKFYLNGRATGMRTLRNKLSASIVSDAPLLVGGRPNELPFPGKLDEVRIYDRALAADEIASIMHAPLRAGGQRTWTDVKGRAIVAEFVDVKDGKIRFCTTEGKFVEIPLDRLSAADQAFLKPKLPPPADIAAGLVAHWNFDDGEGEQARDVVGGHHGAKIGAQWIKGPRGGALHFDGKDDLVRIGSPAALNFAGDVTMTAWICPERVAGTATGGHGDIGSILVHGWGEGAPGELYLRMHLRDAGMKYEVGGFLGEAERTAASDVPASDERAWVHLAGTYDGRTWRLYRNGKLAAEIESLVGAVKTPAAWGIGGHPTEVVRLFQGDIDEVRLYNRALSPEEISELAK